MKIERSRDVYGVLYSLFIALEFEVQLVEYEISSYKSLGIGFFADGASS